MHPVTGSNFAAEMHRRSLNSTLVDAATNECFRAADVARVATVLHAAGLRAGNFLIVAGGIDPQSALAYLGAVYAGIVPIPVADADLDRQVAAIRAATGASFLWTKRRRASFAASSFDGLEVIEGLPLVDVEPSKPAEVGASDVAVLMPTSGSTGPPKLVQVTHNNLHANSHAIIKCQRLTNADRALLLLPPSYCFGASVLHTHLLAGGDIVFDRRMMFPDKVVDSIDRFACTTLAGVPTVFKTLLRRHRFTSSPPRSLRKVFQAGGPLDNSTLLRLRDTLPAAEIFVMYGQTEATARISTLDPADLTDHLGTVGKPLKDIEVRIVRDTDGGQRTSGAGEIWVRGPSVTDGYWRDPEATAKRFQGGWLRTGDIGNIDEDGFLTITGRLGSFVKVRGLRVALGEVEAIAHQVDHVEHAAACGIADDELGEAITLFLVLSPGASKSAVTAQVRRKLPPQWAVQQIHTVDELPRTSNSKIDRTQLHALAKSAAA